MKKRGVEYRKVLAFALTLAVVGLLILSGPARAITVGLTRIGSEDLDENEDAHFTGKVDIHTTDAVTLKTIVIMLDSTPEDSLTNAIFCRYYLNGTAYGNNSESCTLNVTGISTHYSYEGNGYGYGYGYGYKYATGITDTALYNFGYGYQYGYTNGYGANGFETTPGSNPEIVVNFTWTLPSVGADEDYKIGLGVIAGENSDDQVLFLSQSPVELTVHNSDVTPPYYTTNEDDSAGSVNEGEPVEISTLWHNLALDTALFRTNASGSWTVNNTCALSGTDDWCNATILTEGHPGERICWNVWANDSMGLWNNTMPAHCFDVEDITFPAYSDVSDDSDGEVNEGIAVHISTYWEDNVGLDVAVFRNNLTGAWLGVSTCFLTGTAQWCNKTISTTGHAGDRVCWNVYANDTAGNMNNSMPAQCFEIADITAPYYTDEADDSHGAVDEGEIVNVSARWRDNLLLDHAFLRTNASGAWTNASNCSLSGTSSWCIKEIDTAGYEGHNICWNMVAYDAADNHNTSMAAHCFDVNDITAPAFSNVADNSGGEVTEGDTVTASVAWTDAIGLDTAIFRNNASGSWVTSTCTLSGTSDDCVKSISTTDRENERICWNMYANDTSDNLNDTMENQCFTVEARSSGSGFTRSSSTSSSYFQSFSSDLWPQVSSVELSLTSRQGGLNINVQMLDSLSLGETGFAIAIPSSNGAASTVYKYLKITPNQDINSIIKSAKIKFEVDKEWLAQNGISMEDIVLMRYSDGVWTELPTTMVFADGVNANYEATTPGFSYFAITVRNKASAPVITPEPTPTVCVQVITKAINPSSGECREFPTSCAVPAGWQVVGNCAVTPTKIEPQQPTVSSRGLSKNEQWAMFLAVVVIALLVVWLFVYRRPPRDKFFDSRFKNHNVPHHKMWKRPPIKWP